MEHILQGEIGTEITLDSFKGGDSFLINSYGGSLFDGLSMYDFIKGSEISVGVIGVCASAATLPVIASSNSWATPNSRFLIHNPSVEARGEASDMKRTAEELQIEQQRAVDLYAQHLTISREEIQSLMNEEKFITAQQALEIGLIKEIKEYSKTETVKPEADLKLMFNKFKMKIEMSENATKQDVSKLEALINDVKQMFTKKDAPKMIVLTASTGEALDFGEIMTEEEIAVGVKATVNGAAAEGSFIMPDGKTLVFVGGELTEIVEPEPEADLSAENEELKKQLEAAQAEINEKSQMLATLNSTVDKLENEFKMFKGRFSNNKPIVNTTPVENKTNKFTYKPKK